MGFNFAYIQNYKTWKFKYPVLHVLRLLDMHVLKNAMSLIQRKKLHLCLSPLPKHNEVVGKSLICERKYSDRYGTDLMQRRVCMRVRVVLLASVCDSTLECEELYSRV